METKQTAVQWLQDKLFELEIKIDSKTHEEAFFIFERAKAMEKDLIEKAYESGCIGEMWELNFTHSANQYYEKTYGK